MMGNKIAVSILVLFLSFNYSLCDHLLTKSDGENSTSKISFSFESQQNISNEYWIQLARAKVMALVVNQTSSSSPKLDRISQAILSGNCWTYTDGYDKACQDFTEICAFDEARLLLNTLKKDELSSEDVRLYMGYIWRSCGMNISLLDEISDNSADGSFPSPQVNFRCRSRLSNDLYLTTFQMGYQGSTSDSTGLPKNMPSELIPRYFVVEVGDGEGNWELDTDPVKENWIFRFDHGTNLDRMQIRVTPVSSKYTYPPVTSEIIRSYKTSQLVPRKPINLKVEGIGVDLSSDEAPPSASALLSWESDSGLNASCTWELFYTDENNKKSQVSDLLGVSTYWTQLNNLQFGHNYSVRIIEKFQEGLEAELDFQLDIPECIKSEGSVYGQCKFTSTGASQTGMLSLVMTSIGLVSIAYLNEFPFMSM